MNDSQNSLQCPVCGGSAVAQVFQSSNGYPIVRCGDCALVFTDARTAPPPSQLYPAFDQTESGVPSALRKSLGVFARQREAIVRSVKKEGRLLDFGCGSGAFARWMADAGGYDVVGLEPFSLGRPTEGTKLLLMREPLETAAPKLGHFDVITLWHVLEHVTTPVDVLRKLSELLNPDGVIVVSVPNFQSLQSQVFRGSWFHLDPPRHLIHFEAKTLEGALGRAGLSKSKEWNFIPEYGSSGWLQSSLNQVLPHKNYLYEVVKDRGALKDMSPVSNGAHLVASLLLGAPTATLSMPFEAIASAFGRGAALTYAARRAG